MPGNWCWRLATKSNGWYSRSANGRQEAGVRKAGSILRQAPARAAGCEMFLRKLKRIWYRCVCRQSRSLQNGCKWKNAPSRDNDVCFTYSNLDYKISNSSVLVRYFVWFILRRRKYIRWQDEWCIMILQRILKEMAMGWWGTVRKLPGGTENTTEKLNRDIRSWPRFEAIACQLNIRSIATTVTYRWLDNN
jgi:hypothetical protein